MDGESNIVARCVSICIRRPNKCCPVHQDTQVRRSTVVPCRLNDRDRMSIMERHPHNCPLRQPPVIPLIGTTQWKRGHPSNVGVEGFPRHDETWPGTRRWRQPRTKKWALNCTCNDRHIHEHQRPAPDRNKLYRRGFPSRNSRSFASDPRGISSKSTTRPTDIKRSCPSCNRRAYADCTSRQAHTFPHARLNTTITLSTAL